MAEEPKKSPEGQRPKESSLSDWFYRQKRNLIEGGRKALTTVILTTAVGVGSGHIGGKLAVKVFGAGQQSSDVVTSAEPPEKDSDEMEKDLKDAGASERLRQLAKRLGKAGAKAVKKAKEAVKNSDVAKSMADNLVKIREAYNRKVYWTGFFASFLLAALLTYKKIQASRAKGQKRRLDIAVDQIGEIYEIATSGKLAREQENVIIVKLQNLSEQVLQLTAEVDALKKGGNIQANIPVAEKPQKETPPEEKAVPNGTDNKQK